LQLHELPLDRSQFLLDLLGGQHVRFHIINLPLDVPLHGVEEARVLVELEEFELEVLLLVTESLLLEQLRHIIDELLGTLLALSSLLLHKAADVDPLAERDALLEVEASDQRLDTQAESCEMDLSIRIVTIKAPLKVRHIFVAEQELLVVLHRVVLLDLDLGLDFDLVVLDGQQFKLLLLSHLEDAGLVQLGGRDRGELGDLLTARLLAALLEKVIGRFDRSHEGLS